VRRRIAGVALSLLVVSLLSTGVAAGSATAAPGAQPFKFCATAHATLPRHASVGDTVGVGTGMENCDTHRSWLRLVVNFDGPCGTREHTHHSHLLGPGKSFDQSQQFQIPCTGKYRLEVKVFYKASLLDRKIRRMRVTS